MKKAVVVFSGGQDSTTCLVQAQARYDEVHAITFDYGQRHRAEIDTARHLATALGIAAHKVMDDLAALGVDIDAITAKLEDDGIASFITSYDDLLASVENKKA